MKLKEFNSENCLSSRSDKSVPSIGINLSTGLFRLNKAGMELIGLKDGDQVCFHQDEDEPADWYIEKVNAKGFAVRHKESVGSGVLFNNSTLARQIADSVEFKGKSGKCLIAGVPTEFKKRTLWGVITNRLKN